MCGVAAAIGIGSAILGIGSQYMAYQQAKADTKFYNRQRQLAYEGQVLQANANRATERTRKQMNESYQAQVKDMAEIAFQNKNTGITEHQLQLQIKEAFERKETTLAGWRARGTTESAGRIGHTVDFLLADIERTKLASDFLGGQNLAFAFSKTQHDKKVASALMGSRVASAKDYVETTYLDPVQPLKKQGPGFGQYALGMASSALGGFSTYSQVETLRLDKGLPAGGWNLT